jgi:hypothetical protein
MNVSAEKGKEIKSQREKELEELRSKGVAKTRREKLKNCTYTSSSKLERDIHHSLHFLILSYVFWVVSVIL